MITDHDHDKYITTSELSTLATNVVNTKITQANVVTKTNFDNEVSSLDSKIAANKTKNEPIENKLQELKKCSAKADLDILSFLITVNWSDSEDGTQAYLILQPMHRFFKFIASTKDIDEWKSKGLSDESIKPITTSDDSLAPLISYYSYKIRLKFNGSLLSQPKVAYTHKKAVNIYIVYESAGYSSHYYHPTLKNCLFGSVTLTKNADIEKYGYSGYGTGSDRKSSFSFPGGRFGQNVLIFGADMGSSARIDNWKKTY